MTPLFPEILTLIASPFIGSFLGTLVHRLPVGESVIAGRSRCPSCRTTLGVIELVPVLSWLWLRGRCRHCGTTISPWYPGIEVLALGLGLWAFFVTSGAVFLVSCLLGWWLLAVAAVDARRFIIPDVLSLPLIPLGVAALAVVNPDRLLDGILGAALGFLLLFAIKEAFKRVRGREGLGYGDVKLLAGAGSWVGWQGLPGVLLWASLAGLLFALGRLAAGHAMDGSTRLPFGTFLALGLWLVWLYGPPFFG